MDISLVANFKFIIIYRGIRTMIQKIQKIVVLCILFISCTQAIEKGKKLQALLYCWLPAVDTANPNPEYQKLAGLVNVILVRQKINVQVSVCDQSANGALLYTDKIDQLFETYDILQMDVSNIWAIKTDLMEFSREQINKFYDNVYQFQWQPVKRQDKFIGSPGLLCSYFTETRIGDYQKVMYSKVSLAYLYASIFINGAEDRTIDSLDYQNLDKDSLSKVAKFLSNCQEDKSQFDYEKNQCLNFDKKKPFLPSNYATTVGFSQNLFNFINHGIPTQKITINHLVGNDPKKLMFADQFVAKRSLDSDDKKQILKFFEVMLSDEVINIYVQGIYTHNPHLTYLIPPTKVIFDNQQKKDSHYKDIFDQTISPNMKPQIIYQQKYGQKKQILQSKIKDALVDWKDSSHTQL